jgi:hypothetical protein
MTSAIQASGSGLIVWQIIGDSAVSDRFCNLSEIRATMMETPDRGLGFFRLAISPDYHPSWVESDLIATALVDSGASTAAVVVAVGFS